MAKDCIFCKIVAGEIPAKKVLETDHILAFHDKSPSADYHVLIVPKKHIDNIETVSPEDKDVLFEMTQAVQKITKQKNPKKFRVVINGRSYLEVKHLHWHLQAGNLTKHAVRSLLDDAR